MSLHISTSQVGFPGPSPEEWGWASAVDGPAAQGQYGKDMEVSIVMEDPQ